MFSVRVFLSSKPQLNQLWVGEQNHRNALRKRLRMRRRSIMYWYNRTTTFTDRYYRNRFVEILKIDHDTDKTLIIEPAVWLEANENLENAVKRNKEEHKRCFNNQKVWSVPILDPRFVDGGKLKVEKAAGGLLQGFWPKQISSFFWRCAMWFAYMCMCTKCAVCISRHTYA